MVYTPVKNNKKIALVFFVGIVLILLLFILAHFDFIPEILCQATFLIEAIFYTFILNKFVLPVYTYTGVWRSYEVDSG